VTGLGCCRPNPPRVFAGGAGAFPAIATVSRWYCSRALVPTLLSLRFSSPHKHPWEQLLIAAHPRLPPLPTMHTVVITARFELDEETQDCRCTELYYILISHHPHGETHYLQRCKGKVQLWQHDVLEILTTLREGSVGGRQPGAVDGRPLLLPPAEVFPAFRSDFTEFDWERLTPKLYAKRPMLLFSADPIERKERKSYADLEVLFYETVLRHNEHPNIVKYHGSIVVNGRVTALVLDRHSKTLYQRCSDTATPLDVDSIISQVRAALKHLHTNMYVRDDVGNKTQVSYCHNDVHVHNIMVTEDGDREVAVLVDFDSCAQAGHPLGKSMILDPVGKTSHAGIDWRGLEEVETELRRVFPCAGRTPSDAGVQAV